MKMCCAGAHGLSERCMDEATLLATGYDNRSQWFICSAPGHDLEVLWTYPLADWHTRLAVLFAAEDAYAALTGNSLNRLNVWSLDVPGTAPVPRGSAACASPVLLSRTNRLSTGCYDVAGYHVMQCSQEPTA